MNRKKRGKREHGAVTVFLTLILVPCIVFTCAFGDVSRVELSRSQAEAAGDLALYSLLAHYDEELKEWYGLVASCQSIDEFYKVTENYFIGMLDANGIEGTAGETLVSYLSAARNGDFSNFLQLNGLDSVKVTEVPNSGMGSNPALIEDGIVEFMKYRGPVTIVENVIDRLQRMKNSGALSGALDADENEPIVEAKQEYAKAEGEMMNDVLHTYLAIRKYVDYRSANHVPELAKFQNEYPEKLGQIFRDYARMTETITKYYVATDGIRNLTDKNAYDYFPLYTLPDTNNLNNEADAILYVGRNYTYTMSGIGAEERTDEETGKKTYHMTPDDLTKLLEKLDEHRRNVEEAAGRVVTSCQGIDLPVSNGNVNDAVYCMRIQTAVSSSDLNTIHNSGNALMQLYAKLILANWCDFGSDAENITCGQRIDDAMKTIEKIHKDYLSYTTNPVTTFEKLISNYKKVADVTVNMVKNLQYPITSEFLDGKQVPIGTFLEAVREYLGPLLTHLDQQIANIDLILNGGQVTYGGHSYPVVSLSTLKKKIIQYSTARDNWGAEAQNGGTDYARKEQEEYEGAATANDLPAALYEDGGESVEVLRTRLTNIQNDMKSLKTALESCRYGGTRLDQVNRTIAIDAVKRVAPQTVDPARGNYISLYLDQNTVAAKNYHQQLMQEYTYTPPQTLRGESGNEPDLGVDPPALYEFMVEAFPLSRLDDAIQKKEEQEEENKKNQEKAEQEAKNSKGLDKGFLNDLGQRDPIEVSGERKFNAGTAITGLIGAIDKLLSGNFDEFRDQLYVCAYVMEMFSYSSYNNEGQYRLSADPLHYDDYDKGKAQFKDQDLVNRWKEERTEKFTGNKSLTNRMINSQNNRSNLAEVEYVLFGNSTNEKNLTAAYGHIFAMREALNLIAGFVNFYSGSNPTAAAISAMADGIAVATLGVIPVPVTKVVFIGILATLETAHDMNRLKAGLPVAVCKTADNWVIQLPKDAQNLSSIFDGSYQEPDDTNGMFYSDYLLLFMIIASSDSALYSDMLLRVGDLIEGNLNPIPGEGKTDGARKFDLENAHCYFRLEGDVAVKPLLLDIPLVLNFSGDGVDKVLEAKGWCSYKLDIVRGYS